MHGPLSVRFVIIHRIINAFTQYGKKNKHVRSKYKNNMNMDSFRTNSYHFHYLFLWSNSPPVGQGLLVIEASRSRPVRHTTLGRTPLDE